MGFVDDQLLVGGCGDFECLALIDFVPRLSVADTVFDEEFFRNTSSGIAKRLIVGTERKLVILHCLDNPRRYVRRR